MDQRNDHDTAREAATRRPDEETLRLWLDLEADGALDAATASRLEDALEERPDLVEERRELARLHRRLEADRIAVDADFRDAVMRALPAAAWEPTGRRGWGLAAILGVVLAIAGGWTLAASGIGSPSAGPLVGVISAVAEALGASVVTGAGLLGASWRGVGLALEELLASTPSAIVALALGVVLLNALFWRLLRKPAGSAVDRRER